LRESEQQLRVRYGVHYEEPGADEIAEAKLYALYANRIDLMIYNAEVELHESEQQLRARYGVHYEEPDAEEIAEAAAAALADELYAKERKNRIDLMLYHARRATAGDGEGSTVGPGSSAGDGGSRGGPAAAAAAADGAAADGAAAAAAAAASTQHAASPQIEQLPLRERQLQATFGDYYLEPGPGEIAEPTWTDDRRRKLYALYAKERKNRIDLMLDKKERKIRIDRIDELFPLYTKERKNRIDLVLYNAVVELRKSEQQLRATYGVHYQEPGAGEIKFIAPYLFWAISPASPAAAALAVDEMRKLYALYAKERFDRMKLMLYHAAAAGDLLLSESRESEEERQFQESEETQMQQAVMDALEQADMDSWETQMQQASMDAMEQVVMDSWDLSVVEQQQFADAVAEMERAN
jgi:hypothetical protein